MHAPGKGIASSALPYKRSAPAWLKSTPEEICDHIFKLARKGLSPSQIGVILRDSHGVPQVRFRSLLSLASFSRWSPSLRDESSPFLLFPSLLFRSDSSLETRFSESSSPLVWLLSSPRISTAVRPTSLSFPSSRLFVADLSFSLPRPPPFPFPQSSRRPSPSEPT